MDKKMKKRRLKFCVIQKQSLLLRSLLRLDFSFKSVEVDEMQIKN